MLYYYNKLIKNSNILIIIKLITYYTYYNPNNGTNNIIIIILLLLHININILKMYSVAGEPQKAHYHQITSGSKPCWGVPVQCETVTCVPMWQRGERWDLTRDSACLACEMNVLQVCMNTQIRTVALGGVETGKIACCARQSKGLLWGYTQKTLKCGSQLLEVGLGNLNLNLVAPSDSQSAIVIDVGWLLKILLPTL